MIRAVCWLILFVFSAFWPTKGACFYQSSSGEPAVELYGFLGVGIGQFTYPAESGLYDARDDRLWSGDIRLMMETDKSDFHLSTNILQSTRSKPPYRVAAADPVPGDVERSSLLTWGQHDSGRVRSELVADSLHLQHRGKKADFTGGRQPINLATTFYFTPNDFFAPFAPQTFFRNYKPGVDGLRADIRLAELSQLTLLGVLSYHPDKSSSSGWSQNPDWSETSLLVRVSWEIVGFGWALLAGSVDNKTVVGASAQGELFKGIGLRAEGHYSTPENGKGISHYKIAAGLEKLYVGNFSWRVEYFQNSSGGSGTAATFSGDSGGRDYGALGVGWEFSPILTGSLLVLSSFGDDSQLVSGNLLYSLTNESELSLVASIPFGDSRRAGADGSTFADLPRTALLEYRLYF